MTEVAVVILNFNGRNFLQQFLPSVLANTDGAHIIVADNGSTDDSVKLLQSAFPTVQVISIGKNLGYCGGYNFALKQIEATYYVLLNSDVEVTPGWLQPVIQLLKSEDAIAAAQPRILSYHQKDTFEYAGAAGGYIDALGYPFCRGRIFSTCEKDNGQYNDTRPVFWATGACLFIKAKVFHEMGGFDEDFFAHMEEIDLCWKLNRVGYKVFYCAESKVYHVGGGTLSSSHPQKTYYNFRNGLILLVKHLPAMGLIWKLPVRMMLDWLSALFFLLQGRPGDSLAVLKAHLHFIGKMQSHLQKRNAIYSQIGSCKVHYRFPPPIVITYYLLRKQRFE